MVPMAPAMVMKQGARNFFHLDLTDTPRESLLALCFAAILIFLMVGGSLWIMFDLHHRMGTPPEHLPPSQH
jgi:heme/copper-type cytochrome/quinol oxidase subunit 4